MVTSATSLGRSGLHDWMIQRVRGVVLAAYVIYLVGFCMAGEVDFAAWQGLFSQLWFKIFSIIAIASLSFHAWIGLWIVSTDYIKPTWLRLIFQVAVILICLAFIIWGVSILWGV
jgi:succinate dehydrogenase / fumarate reductase membrane anchor subunit